MSVGEPSATPSSGLATRLPKETPPAPTRSVADLRSDLPTLRGLALILNDFIAESDDNQSYWADQIRSVTDVTEEMAGQCLVDCSKALLDTTYGKVTVTVQRAGDTEKATRTVGQLRTELNSGESEEWSTEHFRQLRNLVPDAWIIEHQRLDLSSIDVGAARGVIVGWVRLQFDICGIREGGVFCEGDVGDIAGMASWILVKQLEKLAQAGY